MSTLIPIKQWEEFKKLTPTQLRLMRACEVYDGDEGRGENYLFTFIPYNPYDGVVSDNIRTKAEYLGMSTNSIYPAELPANTGAHVDPYPNLTKAREARRRKLEKVAV